MSSLTIFLSRLIGLSIILIALPLLMHRQTTFETLSALIRNPPLLFIAGMVFLVAGLAIVLSHNVWTAGVLPAIVTLIGWGTLLRGLILLSLSPETLARLFGIVHFEQLFYPYLGITLVIGAYLTYGGFKSALNAARK